MNNRKQQSSKAAYLRRRKQKIMKKLKQLHDSKRSQSKVGSTSRLLCRTQSEMSQLMDLV
ncbi:hypothetical protein [Shewanella aestuarii]|uniref:Uncharacterized protein n=1 Tax=Shewanella aestuarii TaxID=1028752 RepID=A0A6G9QPC4_9GAMM|nr:hypothetical protein [Shewanella aestuarii]QIR16332.1 hypothetical protein HBH39_17760 [Shewanella aestuarii]